MDHSTIDRDNIAERYVTGRLPPETMAAFEEHYLECPDCCLRVETAERMGRGLRRLEKDEARSTEPRRPAGWTIRPAWGLAAAALLALALLPAGWQYRNLRELRAELDQTRGRLARIEAERGRAEPPPREGAARRAEERLAEARLDKANNELSQARKDLDAAGEERRALADQLAAARSPRADLPILSLSSSRGGADPAHLPTLRLPKEPGLVALWVEPGDGGFPAYRVILKAGSGATLLDASGLALNDLGALLLTVHSSSLSPGVYRLEIEGRAPGGRAVPVDRFDLHVTASR